LMVDVLPDIVESEFKKGKHEPTLNCEIHFSMDPWSEVKKLRKQVEELGKKGRGSSLHVATGQRRQG